MQPLRRGVEAAQLDHRGEGSQLLTVDLHVSNGSAAPPFFAEQTRGYPVRGRSGYLGVCSAGGRPVPQPIGLQVNDAVKGLNTAGSTSQLCATPSMV